MTTQAARRNRIFEGVVVKANGQKTIVVSVSRRLWHPKYGRQYSVSRKFHVHDEKNVHTVGETVHFIETRPLSKTKRWRVIDNGKKEQE